MPDGAPGHLFGWAAPPAGPPPQATLTPRGHTAPRLPPTSQIQDALLGFVHCVTPVLHNKLAGRMDELRSMVADCARRTTGEVSVRAACRAPSPFTPLGPCVPPRQHNRSPCLHAAAYLMQTPHRNASHRPVPRPPAAARETATPSTVAATRCSSCQAPSLTATSRATHLKASLRAAPAAPRRRASPRSATASCAPRPCCACCSRTSGAAGGAAWS